MKVIGLFCCLAVLASSTCGVVIHCSNQINNWAVGVGILYGCRADVLSAENPSIFTEVSGSHTEGRNDTHVRGFQVESGHGNLVTIPSGLENFFEHLEAFSWFNGNLATIDSVTFKPWPNLKEISLSHNNIVSLDGDLYQYTRKLVWISFQQNRLEHVGYDLLTGLTDLTRAAFVANPCINVFATTPQAIQELNLQLPIRCPPLPATLYPPSTTTSGPSTPDPPAPDSPAPDPPVPTPIPTTTNSSSCLHAHKLLFVWSICSLMLTMSIRAK